MVTRAMMMIGDGEAREGSPNELTHLHLAFGKGFGSKERKKEKKKISWLRVCMLCMYIHMAMIRKVFPFFNTRIYHTYLYSRVESCSRPPRLGSPSYPHPHRPNLMTYLFINRVFFFLYSLHLHTDRVEIFFSPPLFLLLFFSWLDSLY